MGKGKPRRMDPRLRIVTKIPLTVLWDEKGADLPMTRGQDVLSSELRRLLREGCRVVIADVGSKLTWLDAVAARRLASALISHTVDLPSDAWADDFEEGYCYLCTRWSSPDGQTTLLLEKHH